MPIQIDQTPTTATEPAPTPPYPMPHNHPPLHGKVENTVWGGGIRGIFDLSVTIFACLECLTASLMAHMDHMVIYHLWGMREERNLNRRREQYLEYAPQEPIDNTMQDPGRCLAPGRGTRKETLLCN